MSRRQFNGSAQAAGARTATRAAPQPITAHRLFPALIALWFAALFGLGSFAVPASLIERLIGASGLATLVPAAAPPLGLTARLLIAGAMTMLGVVSGLLLGLRLRPRPAAVVRRRGATARTYAEDDVTEAEAAPAPAPAEDEAPQVRAFDAHPDAPPRKPFVLSEDLVLQSAVEAVVEPVAAWDHGPEIELAETETPEIEAPEIETVVDAEWSVIEAGDADDGGKDAGEAFAPPQQAAPHSVVGALAGKASVLADAPIETLGLVQLVERLALALESRRLPVGDGPPFMVPPVSVAEVVPEVAVVAAPVVPVAAPEPSIVPAAVDTAVAPFAPPRQVFVVPPEAVPDPAAPEVEDEVEAKTGAVPVEALQPVAIPRLFGAGDAPARPPRIMAAHWDAPADDVDAEDIVVPRFLGRGTPDTAPRQEFIRPARAAAVETGDTPVMPPRPEPVSAEPIVVFPGQGHRAAAPRPVIVPTAAVAEPSASSIARPQAAEDTERALKAALATLQRMTARG